jgi:hypothetical protein
MLITIALALATEVPPVDRRADLQRFSGRLEQRLAAACRPAEPMAFLSGLPETRFVYLDGVGAIFLLPPRSLPVVSMRKPDQPPPEISVSGAQTGPQVVVFKGKRPSDLVDMEARIRETRKEAERMRAQADATFADAERQLMAEMRIGTADANVAALQEDSVLLKSLRPTDTVTVSVELVSRPQPWVRAKPARTLIVTARKADLDAFATGKINQEELVKRVQAQAY